ncbi:MAG TPA: DUF1015 domain-containing protein [Bacilli bacterium]|nr:DUF1015 domain-containing protein [Bacilli bacterium]
MSLGNKMNTIRPAHILLPNAKIDMTKWAVIACDQYTSQPNYWEKVKAFIGDAPSTLHLILPEVYLEKNNAKAIKEINDTMISYIEDRQLIHVGEGFILVERSTPHAPKRLGLMISVDLEDYSYEPGAKTLIRATEGTILSRIPPREKIRKNAPLEFPHTLILADDPKKEIIEGLYNRRHEFKKVYDFDLMMDGGHITGYLIEDTTKIMKQFYNLIKQDSDPLLFLVGDGNHSLATSKSHWNHVKSFLTEEERVNHPARYALVEVINLYDEGISFESIHRVVFKPKPDFLPGLMQIAKGEYDSFVYQSSLGKLQIKLPSKAPHAYQVVQQYIDQYTKKHRSVKVDYVHGDDHMIEVCDRDNSAIGIYMPALTKEDLFDFIKEGQVLPKKSFSMGHACEKRFYLEGKIIK